MKKQKSLFILLVICLIGLIMLPLVSSCNKEPEFNVPIQGAISSIFGMRKSPLTGEEEFHNGIDIAAYKGTPIIAAASGIVTKAGWEDAYGNLVIIKHNNEYSTYYGKCDTILVKEGQTVKSGETIATCGRTGLATGNHLHFEIRKDGRPVNPEPYLHKKSRSEVQKEDLRNHDNDLKVLRSLPLIPNNELKGLRQFRKVNRSEIKKEILDNIDNALKGLRAGPHRVNGVIAGYKLFMVSPSNILFKYGARSGDIIKSINRQPINNIGNIFGLEETLKEDVSFASLEEILKEEGSIALLEEIIEREKSIIFTIERNGELQDFEFNFIN